MINPLSQLTLPHHHHPNMPLVEETVSTGGLVPTINIAAFIADSSSIEAEKVVQAVRSACLTTGFFQITGHGVPSELQNATFDAAAAFFARPVEHKKKIDIHKSVGHRGYDMMGTQKYGDDLLPDMKEVCVIRPSLFRSLD